ncbi:hypothetical protein LTR62_000024 [Meristemomyces frigidus]|uniref:Uncharacterized protein n=1 Tax=Meristemomyces frigidus TaxID=1508187 RepID=A0AAN7TIZ8_9PEZI|nr:hypothetical protein LTR62_000024 [Meristemomyces frigidus]
MTSRQSYLDSHPSLNASMDDFAAPNDFSPTVPEYPSHHSGFQSRAGSEYSEASSSGRRSYSPPAWRKAGSGWFQQHQQQRSLSPVRRGSQERGPGYHDEIRDGEEEEGDVTAHRIATGVPLPGSPVKGRSVSNTPEPDGFSAPGEVDRGDEGGRAREQTPLGREEEGTDAETPTQRNYFRFSTRLDVVQRTQPIEDTVNTVCQAWHHMGRSKLQTFLFSLGALLVWMLGVQLLATPSSGPVPDIIKVAGLARALEPAIYYSERGHLQIGELQDTGVAVWDLGESVRNTNMTSAPVIVHQLDDLSESIKTLAAELTHFFASVDGDIDNILNTMEWASRELVALSSAPPSTLSAVWSNTHTLLTHAGLMSQSLLAQKLLGQTHQQKTRYTLERVFHEYLSVLEDSIQSELKYSQDLFTLFEAIDNQFLNLQRSVIREQDTQDRLSSDFLSSLWTQVLGVNASKLRKYEKNRSLLASVRDRTVKNKHVLVDHNQRLRTLQSNLEMLRRKLVSPLVRSWNSSSVGVEEQIRGLEGVYWQLRGSREVQRKRMMEVVFGDGKEGRRGGEGRTIGDV